MGIAISTRSFSEAKIASLKFPIRIERDQTVEFSTVNTQILDPYAMKMATYLNAVDTFSYAYESSDSRIILPRLVLKPIDLLTSEVFKAIRLELNRSTEVTNIPSFFIELDKLNSDWAKYPLYIGGGSTYGLGFQEYRKSIVYLYELVEKKSFQFDLFLLQKLRILLSFAGEWEKVQIITSQIEKMNEGQETQCRMVFSFEEYMNNIIFAAKSDYSEFYKELMKYPYKFLLKREEP